MLRKITINLLTIIVLALNSPALLAQPDLKVHKKITPRSMEVSGLHSTINSNSEQTTRPIARKPLYSPFTRLQRLLRNTEVSTEFYEYLLGYPRFLKLQDMAQRVWEKQTSSKRRVVTWSRRNIISPNDLPVRTPKR